MASGHVNRANRPNIWQLRPTPQSEDSSCQPGAVHTWPFIPHRRFRFSSGRLRDLDIASNAAGDIVEIRSALVEIR
jgi:hypothetical protein